MHCTVTAWTHTDVLDADANCPSCGQNGFGHKTVFVGEQIGRHCLECHAAWPIDVQPIQTEPTDA